jgi:hypothetical protein
LNEFIEIDFGPFCQLLLEHRPDALEDVIGVVAPDRWTDPDSADRYAHVVVSDVAKRADLLPVEKRKRA